MYKQFLELNGIRVCANGTYVINGMVFGVDVPLRVAMQASSIPTAYATPYVASVLSLAHVHAPIVEDSYIPRSPIGPPPSLALVTPLAPIVEDAYIPRSPIGPPPSLALASTQVYDLTTEDREQDQLLASVHMSEQERIIKDYGFHFLNKGIHIRKRTLAKKQANTDFDCPICYESTPCIKSMITDCDHRYCLKCTTSLVRSPQRHLNCPLCRTKCYRMTYFKPRKVAVKGK
jgi:hypothetical protein